MPRYRTALMLTIAACCCAGCGFVQSVFFGSRASKHLVLETSDDVKGGLSQSKLRDECRYLSIQSDT